MSEDLNNLPMRELVDLYNAEKPADAKPVWRFPTKGAAIRRIEKVRADAVRDLANNDEEAVWELEPALERHALPAPSDPQLLCRAAVLAADEVNLSRMVQPSRPDRSRPDVHVTARGRVFDVGDSDQAEPDSGPTGAHTARGPSATHADDQIVRLLVGENPKKPGSKAAARFALYQDGMSVGEFLAAGGRRADLHWDTRRGFVEIANPGCHWLTEEGDDDGQ